MRTTLRDAAATAGARRNRRVGRVDRRLRAGDRRQRVDPFERVDQTAGRELVVEPREDHGLLRVVAQVGLAGQVEQHRAERPAQREPGRSPEHPAAGRVEWPDRPDHECAARGPTEQHADELAERRAHRPADQRDERDEPRLLPADETGRELGADDRPRDETAEREHPGHEPATETADRSDGDDGEDDEVEHSHVQREYAAAASAPAAARRGDGSEVSGSCWSCCSQRPRGAAGMAARHHRAVLSRSERCGFLRIASPQSF